VATCPTQLLTFPLAHWLQVPKSDPVTAQAPSACERPEKMQTACKRRRNSAYVRAAPREFRQGRRRVQPTADAGWLARSAENVHPFALPSLGAGQKLWAGHHLRMARRHEMGASMEGPRWNPLTQERRAISGRGIGCESCRHRRELIRSLASLPARGLYRALGGRNELQVCQQQDRGTAENTAAQPRAQPRARLRGTRAQRHVPPRGVGLAGSDHRPSAAGSQRLSSRGRLAACSGNFEQHAAGRPANVTRCMRGWR
jgi:hypothetical protein